MAAEFPPIKVDLSQVELVEVAEEFKHQVVFIGNNKKIWQTLRDAFPHPYTISDADKWVAFCKSQATPCPFLFIATKLTDGLLGQLSEAHREAVVEDKASMLLLGSISCTPAKDVHRCTAELGYFIGEQFWGGGIASHAVRLCVERTFQLFPDVVRIFAEPYAGNAASARVLEKNGFSFEGRLRCNALKCGEYRDSLMYSLLRSEFPSLKPSQK